MSYIIEDDNDNNEESLDETLEIPFDEWIEIDDEYEEVIEDDDY